MRIRRSSSSRTTRSASARTADAPADRAARELRAQPNLDVVRPADANETALAYRFALAQEHTPTAIVLSRQGVAVIGPEDVPQTAVERGAYVLHEAQAATRCPTLILGAAARRCSCAATAPPPCSRPGRRDARRLDAVHGALRASRTAPTATRSCRRGARSRLRRGPQPARHGSATAGDAGEVIGMSTFGASARRRALQPLRLHPRARGRGGPRNDRASGTLSDGDAAGQRAAGRHHRGRARASGSTRSGRGLIECGELRRLVEEDSLRGVTSNPTIFNRAILGAAGLRRPARAARARGHAHAGDLPGRSSSRTSSRRATSCAGLRRDGTARRLRVAARSIRTWPSTPRARWRRRASTASASIAPTS
jgi:hypothetical protein